MSKKIFTIGHSNLDIDQFIELLKKHEITALGDVRSHPYSRYLPHFCKDQLQRFLANANISYVFLGKELGARPENINCYVNGKALYEKIADTDLFKQGIERIIKGSEKYKIALMCAEKDPITCHRAILICQQLRKFDVEINHILSDGSLESHQQLEERLLKLYEFAQPSSSIIQLSLFDSLSSPVEKPSLSLEECLKQAYTKQGNKIAYVEKT
jgi:uncharacterized protein (DUF488 family)